MTRSDRRGHTTTSDPTQAVGAPPVAASTGIWLLSHGTNLGAYPSRIFELGISVGLNIGVKLHQGRTQASARPRQVATAAHGEIQHPLLATALV
ncbi:Hypothetical protein NTJ_06355 [Nesidiocoris tenuis]|uniref:Uncharacterized protein n=1 Tax=Nesidiocoris tenuis TaxID=355587 RepID=A0ABN7AMU8_9HEMI|nr:Hypothetical protein NTJ_06355 [Nesidiocoris tenuis]